jgi:hypothetical protein
MGIRRGAQPFSAGQSVPALFEGSGPPICTSTSVLGEVLGIRRYEDEAAALVDSRNHSRKSG